MQPKTCESSQPARFGDDSTLSADACREEPFTSFLRFVFVFLARFAVATGSLVEISAAGDLGQRRKKISSRTKF
jgi:hypothetical protein